MSCAVNTKGRRGWAEQRTLLPGGRESYARRRVTDLPGGLVWIEEQARIRGRISGPFAMGEHWMIQCVALRRGTVVWSQDGRRITIPTRRFVWVLPAFSVVNGEMHNAEFDFVGLAAPEAPGTQLPRALTGPSRVFPFRGKLPTNAVKLLRVLESLGGGISVEITAVLVPLVRRAKVHLERNFRTRVSIASLARDLGVTHAHLTREFRRVLGMSPLKYVHALRGVEAMHRLTRGEHIVGTSLGVGYDDLSRFYKHFKRLGCAAPGRYRAR